MINLNFTQNLAVDRNQGTRVHLLSQKNFESLVGTF
jgi:hypothetical protein